MNRRNFVATTAMGGTAAVVLSQIGCGGKSISGEVLIIDGAIASLQILFPNVPALGKIRKLAKDFSDAWTAGKFSDARTFFENLDTLVQQVIDDLGLNASARVKLLLAVVGIAVRTIAALINEQGQQQPAAVEALRANAPATVDRVTALSDPAAADSILKAVRRH